MVKTTQYLLYWMAYIPIRFIINVKVTQCEISADDLKQNSYILIANHVSRLDQFFLLALPWRIYKNLIPVYFLTSSQIYNKPWLRPFLFLFGSYSLPTSSWTFEKYFNQTLDKILSGKNIMIFPEGEIKRGSQSSGVSPGLGYLISKTNTPLLPIHIKGVKSFRYTAFIFRKNNVRLDIKKPFTIDSDHLSDNIETYQNIAEKAFRKISE